MKVSRDSAVGVATGYDLDGQRIETILPLRVKINVKIKVSQQQALEARRVVGRRGCHIFYSPFAETRKSS
jgi:hypothetical protein